MSKEAQEFWNQRYKETAYAYGVEPNEFLKSQLPKYTPGTILFPAEGEGRNALYAAKQGWQVDAFDSSEAGKQKALDLFNKNSLSLNYTHAGYENFEFQNSRYDMVASIFAHTDHVLRKSLLKKYVEVLKPGGILLLVGFSKNQLKYHSGGPKSEDWLYDLSIVDEIPNCSIIHQEEIIINLDEGSYHQGQGSVIQIIAKKEVG